MGGAPVQRRLLRMSYDRRPLLLELNADYTRIQ